jgi:hypothetical protein
VRTRKKEPAPKGRPNLPHYRKTDPVDGIFIAEYEQGEIGNVLFKVACNMGSRGMSRSTSTAPMAPADAPTGLRSSTPHIRLTAESGTNYFSHCVLTDLPSTPVNSGDITRAYARGGIY